MNSAQVIFREINQTNVVTTPLNGISFIRGKSLRGPFDDPKDIITSWPQFVRIFGGFIEDDSALLVKRLLDKGGFVRFSKAGHYTTITDRSTLTAVKAVKDAPIVDADDVELFEFPIKYAGADYNNIKVEVKAGSNGVTGFFDIIITHANDSSLTETYANLRIEGDDLTAANSDFLRAIVDGSQLVNVVYKNLSALTADPIIPIPVIISYENGTDGGAIVDADIIGDAASNTGFYSFDEYEDSYQVMVVTTTVSDAVHIAGSAYAGVRKDLLYWGFLPNTLTTATALINKRASLNIDSKYTALFGGGLIVTDPINGSQKSILATTDIAALAASSDENFGPWYSFAGNQRGTITGALGVVNNFGTPAKAADLNLLANRQIGMIINRDGAIRYWNGLTAQIRQNQESFINVVRNVIYTKKTLRPTLENYLEEPNDIPTWRLMYFEVKPFLDSMVERRAWYQYTWQGDQDAKNLSQLVVNNQTDVQQGKYKAILSIWIIPGLREITIELTLRQDTQTIAIIDNP